MNRKSAPLLIILLGLYAVSAMVLLFSGYSCSPAQAPDANGAFESRKTWTKENHGGHVYLIRHGDGYAGTGATMVHDPDCPCRKKSTQKPE